jgi:protein-disulfide isomerase
VARDVFISYSHHDKQKADAVCAALEAKGIRCWIAPRDVIPGQEWGGAIIEAIRSSRVMVLVFSSHANASPQIRREVERAVNAETVLIPFRIEDVAPAQSLEFFLGTPHWLDALTPPFEAHLARLATAVQSFLTTSSQTSREELEISSESRSLTSVQPSPRQPLLRRLSRRTKVGVAAGAIVAVVAIAVAVSTGSQWFSGDTASSAGASDTVRVASSKLVTKPATGNPAVVVSFYEDFLCPPCGDFERTLGPTVSNLINIGAIAADYSLVSFLDSVTNQDYSSRAGVATLCVADESVDAFRRFHATLFSTGTQPDERGSDFPDNAKLIELAREAGASGKVADCINKRKYIATVREKADAAHITAVPKMKINGVSYDPSTPDGLVAKIKQIVGDVPGIDTAATPRP